MSLPPRKVVELQGKARALATELDAWRKQAAAGQPFEKHHSQVERLATQILAAMEQLGAEITAAGAGPETAPEIERRILDFHRVWDFFRSKLVLRAFDYFRLHLAAADELAFACYRPLVEGAGVFKEPPLTYFSATSDTPYALPRNKSYEHAFPGPGLPGPAVGQLLKALPVPVVSLPWFQQGHLPDLAIVAHEVGHHVEDDLGLTPALLDALRQAALPPERVPAWTAWCGEVFADEYATLALGRGFARALIDFLLASDVAAMRAEAVAGPRWGQYPTAPLRLAVAREVLRTRETLDEETEKAMAPLRDHAMADFEPDCERVVAALSNAPLPRGGTVGGLIAFDGLREAAAATQAKAALEASALASRDVRELVAAAAIAFARDPVRFYAPGPGGTSPAERIRTRITESIEAGVRGAGDRPAVAEQKQAVAAHRAGDREAGTALLASLRFLGGGPPAAG